MKVVSFAARCLFILCLPVLLLTATVAGAFNSLGLYTYGFNKYDVAQTTGLTNTELEKAARGLIAYFNSEEEYVSVVVLKNDQPLELFNQREAIHLKDVKGLIWLDYWVLLGTLIFAAGYAGFYLLWQRRRYWRQLAWGVVGGGMVTLVLVLALGLGTLFGFEQLFLQFHLISFANPFWQLDPSTDYLIMLFPEGFWYDVTLFGALVTALGAVLLGGVAGLCLWRVKG